MTTPQRIGVLAATVVVLIVAFVLLRPGGDDGGSTGPSGSSNSASSAPASSAPSASTSTSGAPAEQPAVKTVRVVNGQPQGGIKTLSFKKGDRIRLRVVSDVGDEIHIHGYDLKKDVAKGGSVQFSFPASIEGRFEIELENAGTQIATLEVDPA